PGENVVRPQASRELHHPEWPVAVDREDELLRPDQVGRQPSQPLALAHCLEHEADVSLLEITEAAVDQLRGSTRGAGREIRALDERGAESAHRRVARDAR